MSDLADEVNNIGGHQRGITPMEGRKSSDGAYDNKTLDKEGAPRHLFIEFFGTMIITLITSGAVLSTGALNVKYDLEEVRPGRIFGIAFANAAVSNIYIYIHHNNIFKI